MSRPSQGRCGDAHKKGEITCCSSTDKTQLVHMATLHAHACAMPVPMPMRFALPGRLFQGRLVWFEAWK